MCDVWCVMCDVCVCDVWCAMCVCVCVCVASPFITQKNTDVYSTLEPQMQFHKRICFCLTVHNDAVKVHTHTYTHTHTHTYIHTHTYKRTHTHTHTYKRTHTHTSHITHHTSHITHHTSHITHYTSHHTPHITHRLRHNVIKTALRKINISYSRISLADICEKLRLGSIEDTGVCMCVWERERQTERESLCVRVCVWLVCVY